MYKRISITIPKYINDALEASLPERAKSKFIVEAVEEKLFSQRFESNPFNALFEESDKISLKNQKSRREIKQLIKKGRK